jgi:hypothetical protein
VSLIARYLEEEYLLPSERSRALTLGNGGETARMVAEQFSGFFKPVNDPSPPVRGSIISFPSLSYPYGHVAIVTDVEIIDNQFFRVKIVDSNSPEGRVVVNHNYWITIDNKGNGNSGYGSRIEWVNPRDTLSNPYLSAPTTQPINSGSSASNNPQLNPSLPGTIPILPGTTPIILPSIFSVFNTITSKGIESVVYLKSTNSKPIIYGDKPTWVLIHGMDNSPLDMSSIADSLIKTNSNAQILALDWTDFAKTKSSIVIDGASHINDVATWAAKKKLEN